MNRLVIVGGTVWIVTPQGDKNLFNVKDINDRFGLEKSLIEFFFTELGQCANLPIEKNDSYVTYSPALRKVRKCLVSEKAVCEIGVCLADHDDPDYEDYFKKPLNALKGINELILKGKLVDVSAPMFSNKSVHHDGGISFKFDTLKRVWINIADLHREVGHNRSYTINIMREALGNDLFEAAIFGVESVLGNYMLAPALIAALQTAACITTDRRCERPNIAGYIDHVKRLSGLFEETMAGTPGQDGYTAPANDTAAHLGGATKASNDTAGCVKQVYNSAEERVLAFSSISYLVFPNISIVLPTISIEKYAEQFMVTPHDIFMKLVAFGALAELPKGMFGIGKKALAGAFATEETVLNDYLGSHVVSSRVYITGLGQIAYAEVCKG